MTEVPRNMRQKIEQPYEELKQDVRWLYVTWQVFLQLYGTHDHRALLNDMAPTFCRVCGDALGNAVLLGLSRLSDPAKSCGKDNLSLKGIVGLLGEWPELKSQARKGIKKLKDLLAPMRDWRNKVIAHRDRDTALQDAAFLSPVEIGQIEASLSAVGAFMNEISRYFGDPDTPYGQPCGDGEAIIRYLKESRAYQKHRREGRVDPNADGVC